MEYFKKVTSLQELKKQYYTLAMQHHPDKGGVLAIMQSINCEYDILFTQWRGSSEVVTEEPETGQASRQKFYSQNGWAGKRYNSNLNVKQISVILREYVKHTFPECKFSISIEDYRVIRVMLMAAPFEAFTECGKRNIETQHVHNYLSEKLTPEANNVMLAVAKFLNQYRMQDSDIMTDYFNTNFYIYTGVGRWNKDFVVDKARAKKTNKVANT